MRRRFLPFQRRIGRRRTNPYASAAFLAAASLGIIYLFFSSFTPSLKENPAQQAVNQFYKLEQKGDFGSSWDLFHSQMKERFKKESYIQQRAHLFLEHFGVESFEYKLGSVQPIDTWKMTPQAPPLANVYRIPVTQIYESKWFGTFAIQQDIYAAKEDEQWRILWPYVK